jgi:hypothetical protein
MNQETILKNIINSAKASLDALKPAIRERHYVVGMKSEIGIANGCVRDLYNIVLDAETALEVLIAASQKVLEQTKHDLDCHCNRCDSGDEEG